MQAGHAGNAAERMTVQVPIDDQSAIDFLVGQPVLSTLFDTQFVADPAGRMVAFVEGKAVRSAGLEIGDRPYFRDTVQQGVRSFLRPCWAGRRRSR